MLPKRKKIRLPSGIYAESGRLFAITIATSPRSPVFANLDFGQACVRCLAALGVATSTPVHAYCLMPDHAHLLIEVGGLDAVSFVQRWKSLCYQERRRRGHPARFWQRGFLDRALRLDEDRRVVARYILQNPVRAGMVSDAGEYALVGSMAGLE